MHALQRIFHFFGRSWRWQRKSALSLSGVGTEVRRFLKVTLAVTALTCVGAVHAATAFVVSDTSSNLLRVNSTTGAATLIGNTGAVGPLTDLAVSPTGVLWGITFTSLYRINPSTGALTFVGEHGVFAANALAFAPNGTLYTAAGDSPVLYTLNTSTGAATALPGGMGTNSDGDLAFNNGQLYLAGTNGQLVRITLGATITGTNVGSFGVVDVYGLAPGAAGTLLALAGRTVYEANIITGALTPLFSYTGFGVGLGMAQISTVNIVPILFYLLDD